MLQDILSDFAAKSDMPVAVWGARLLGTAILCGLIGFEREIEERPAGLRTHILIGLAAAANCLVMLYLVQAEELQSDHIKFDPIRVIEAVTQGVAFLAAGLVVFAQGRMRGLKTGATMWLAASIGIACGLGLWLLAVAVTILALAVITLIRAAEKYAGTHRPGHAALNDED